jgi:hypothetical protein
MTSTDNNAFLSSSNEFDTKMINAKNAEQDARNEFYLAKRNKQNFKNNFVKNYLIEEVTKFAGERKFKFVASVRLNYLRMKEKVTFFVQTSDLDVYEIFTADIRIRFYPELASTLTKTSISKKIKFTCVGTHNVKALASTLKEITLGTYTGYDGNVYSKYDLMKSEQFMKKHKIQSTEWLRTIQELAKE